MFKSDNSPDGFSFETDVFEGGHPVLTKSRHVCTVECKSETMPSDAIKSKNTLAT